MSHKSFTGNAAVKSTDQPVRITTARSFYRNTVKKMSLVPPAAEDPLLRKEEDCCSRATD